MIVDVIFFDNLSCGMGLFGVGFGMLFVIFFWCIGVLIVLLWNNFVSIFYVNVLSFIYGLIMFIWI